jgi:hypothetical protein
VPEVHPENAGPAEFETSQSNTDSLDSIPRKIKKNPSNRRGYFHLVKLDLQELKKPSTGVELS